MDTNFFKKIRILDGGMGQELLAKGMKTKGTLWSANAVLDPAHHQLLVDTHLDFIEAGAEVIVTTTFCTRRQRLQDNGAEWQFEYANRKAGELAVKAVSCRDSHIGRYTFAQWRYNNRSGQWCVVCPHKQSTIGDNAFVCVTGKL